MHRGLALRGYPMPTAPPLRQLHSSHLSNGVSKRQTTPSSPYRPPAGTYPTCCNSAHRIEESPTWFF